MYGCESWMVKKAEHWRIDAFELWCWRKLLRVPWTARRSNQSILCLGTHVRIKDFKIKKNKKLKKKKKTFIKIKIKNKGDQSWVFFGRTDAEAKTPILWPPDEKNWFIGKDPDAGKDQRHEKGITEDEMIGWHHQFNEHEFEQAPGVGDGQGGLECCNSWFAKIRTWLSDWTELKNIYVFIISLLFFFSVYPGGIFAFSI